MTKKTIVIISIFFCASMYAIEEDPEDNSCKELLNTHPIQDSRGNSIAFLLNCTSQTPAVANNMASKPTLQDQFIDIIKEKPINEKALNTFFALPDHINWLNLASYAQQCMQKDNAALFGEIIERVKEEKVDIEYMFNAALFNATRLNDSQQIKERIEDVMKRAPNALKKNVTDLLPLIYSNTEVLVESRIGLIRDIITTYKDSISSVQLYPCGYWFFREINKMVRSNPQESARLFAALTNTLSLHPHFQEELNTPISDSDYKPDVLRQLQKNIQNYLTPQTSIRTRSVPKRKKEQEQQPIQQCSNTTNSAPAHHATLYSIDLTQEEDDKHRGSKRAKTADHNREISDPSLQLFDSSKNEVDMLTKAPDSGLETVAALLHKHNENTFAKRKIFSATITQSNNWQNTLEYLLDKKDLPALNIISLIAQKKYSALAKGIEETISLLKSCNQFPTSYYVPLLTFMPREEMASIALECYTGGIRERNGQALYTVLKEHRNSITKYSIYPFMIQCLAAIKKTSPDCYYGISELLCKNRLARAEIMGIKDIDLPFFTKEQKKTLSYLKNSIRNP